MKKVMKSIPLLLTCYCLTGNVFAQNDVDAIRYSQTNVAATARSLSMGGAFGALGADFSALSTNPAGIALYRRSEFTFTPALENKVTLTNYLGKNSEDNKYNFNLGNLGFVWAFPKEKKNSAWKGFAFGLGYNRLNSYHSRSVYEGINKDNSLLDLYVEEAQGNDPGSLYDNYPFSSGLAYEAYAIDVDANDTVNYFSVIPNGGELQRRTKETSGSTGEVVLSFGGNYNDKVYWGVTLGFPYIRYNEDVIYEESDPDNSIQFDTNLVGSAYANAYNFESFTHTQTLATTANGFNAKFGLIIRPIDWIRLGLAVHTPAFYSMHDEFKSSMTTRFENGSNYPFDSPIGTYDYSLTTPFKAIGSAAFIYKQFGILSVDYEFVDYTSAKLHASDYSFADENFVIRNSYAQQHNIRAGIEYKYGIFSFRGGTGFSTGVLKSSVSSTSTDQHKIMYSGGLGIREENYFVDLGYAYAQSNEFYRPYTLENEGVQGAFSKIKDHKFLLTVGFRF
ncbi:MAG TPA: hypothetical protein VJY62_22345 [Bacteroidia bacterium]|nr:hypothetical protein [Bacteroidia bacterium]